jgi:hypothetical protein
MITKSIIASLVLVSGTYGGLEAIDAIKPQTEIVVAQSTIEGVLRNAQYLEMLGDTRDKALVVSIKETPDADGIRLDGHRVVYEVQDTCLVGYLGEEYEKIIKVC